MAKKKSSGEALLIGVGVVIAILAAIPKEVWISLGVLAIIFLVARAFIKKAETTASTPSARTITNPTTPRSADASRLAEDKERFTTIVIGIGDQVYDIPPPIRDAGGKATWVAPGKTIEVAGLSMPGGMFYIGSGLRGSYGRVEPALINPALKVTPRNVDISLRLTDYWPSYSECTPDARRAYLQWLAGGRRAPEANIGYVFLFFYGLERRALVDAVSDPDAQSDISVIKQEVRRLLSIYSWNGSFQRYASQFLGYLETDSVEAQSYKKTPLVPDGAYELPMRLRIGLGQLAIDQQPVPAAWAHAWALTDPSIVRRTAVGRCPEMFQALFEAKYVEMFGEGLRLPVNRTKLKLTYYPASASLRGREFARSTGDLPDVSVLTAPVKKLQEVVNTCTDVLDPYSRFIGRNPDKKDSLEGLLLLPPAYWPAPLRSELNDIKAQVRDGMLVMGFGELTGRLKSAGPLSRDKVLGLARALESLHLGMEPDVLGGQKLPKAEDSVALFVADPNEGASRSTPAYQAAVVTLDLACSVALADGDASGPELLHLSQQIGSWTHLSVAHRKRLKAHLRLGIMQPATLASLKGKLESLAADAKRTIAKFLAHLAEADGVVSPDEVKFLERVYKTLQVDAKLVYSDLHSAGKPVAVSEIKNGALATEFTLNPERIAQLQKETEEVSALLANVFVEEVSEAEIVPTEEEEPAPEPGVLGLDQAYAAFLRMLVSRLTWTRQELADVAADMELMLDGALEHINEAALDNYDAPLVEGDDPIEINQEILEKLPA